jgi:protein-S-isoprenylcysteine O-methyltransferase Ste14
MRQGVKEVIGYLVNGLSIPLYIYVVLTLDIPGTVGVLRYIGWALIVAGIGLTVISMVALVGNKGGGLIDRGIYGIVRHPMYLGGMLCFSAYFFFHPHWLVLLIVTVNVGVIYGVMLQGERENIVKFGDAYKRYMQVVPRMNLLIGLLRRGRKT